MKETMINKAREISRRLKDCQDTEWAYEYIWEQRCTLMHIAEEMIRVGLLSADDVRDIRGALRGY